MGSDGGGSRPSQALVIREVIRTYSYVITWMSISICVILFNKWLLAYSGFPFPIALTMWHMLFCSTVGFLAVRVFRVVKSHNMTAKEYMIRVMPIGLLYAGSLWLSNTSYLFLAVSFIQMTKSLMPGLVYACGCFVGTEKFSTGAAANMVLIAFGVVVCALGEVNLVVKGLVMQLMSLAFEAMRLTLVQVLINSKGYNMNPMQSLYYVSPACLVCLLLPFGVVEYQRMVATTWTLNCSVLLANALTAFALNLAVFMLIGKTSALTMNIAGVIKDWVLIFCSFHLFAAPVTRLNLLGYVFCCAGVVVYNHMKLRALKHKAATAPKDAAAGATAAAGAAKLAAMARKGSFDEEGQQHGGSGLIGTDVHVTVVSRAHPAGQWHEVNNGSSSRMGSSSSSPTWSRGAGASETKAA